QISGYQDKLETIRNTTKEQLTYIEDLTIEDINIRADGVEQIYEYATEFFVNHDPKSKQYQQGLLQQLLTECYQQLGSPPEGCEHSILGLGSLALGTMTPWSDLELAILINEDKPEYKEYFRNLTKLLWIKVINFGETPLAAVGIECLNNYKTGEELDDWFHDDIIEKAFRFDPVYVDACKSPLGRQGGYQIKEKVKDPETKIETGEILIKNEPDYELICTKEQLLEFQQQDHWFECDKHLTQALQTVSLVDGSQKLLDEYREDLNNKVERKIQQERSVKILREDLGKFKLKLGDKEEGNLLDAKKDIYRLGDRIINALANYYNITAKSDEKHITVWQIIEQMENENILSPAGAKHLREAICISTELRLRTYSNNEGRYDNMSTYEFAVDHLDEAQRKALTQKTFHIKDTSILYHFYYVMMDVEIVLDDFCNQNCRDEAEPILREEKLLYDDDYIKGMVHARFLQYDKAIEYLEEIQKNYPEDLDLLQDLLFVYKKTGNIDKTVNVAKTFLSIYKKQNNSNNHITDGYNNLGIAYDNKGEYDKAIEFHQKSLDMYLKTYASNPNHPDISMRYNNLGSTYSSKGEYDKAIEFHQKSLDMNLKTYASNPNHPDIASNYINLGASYMKKGEYDEAIKHYKKSLDIQIIAYATTPNHPDIAGNYINLGASYIYKGEYDEAIKHCKKSLDIQIIAYKTNFNHPDIAMNYANLGASYIYKGEYDEAIKHCKKSLDIQIIAYKTSPNHPDIAMNYMNLGSSYMYKGEDDKAIALYNQSLDIQIIAYESNPNHPDIAKNYANLGVSYMYKGEYDKAIIYYKQALNIQLKAYDTNSNHPDIIRSYVLLSTTYVQKNIPEKALGYALKSGDEELINECLDLNESTGSEFEVNNQNLPQSNTFDDPLKELVSDTQNSIEQAYQQNDLKLAITEQKKLLEIDPALEYGNHYHNLACFFNCDKQITEADKTFLKGITNQNVKITSAFYTEYAQFLIVNENYKKLQIDKEAIAQYLYESVYCNNLGELSYGIIEKDTVCPVLQNLIKDLDTKIEVDPKILAYHLLITNPEYAMEGHNVAEDLLEYANSNEEIINCA
ncbi:MAG: hypothetical protein DGJ47_001156, partial [Rickettsiaceae bacterium]